MGNISDEFHRLHQEGKSDSEIAAMLGKNQSTVSRWRQKAGFPSHSRGRPPGRKDTEQRERSCFRKHPDDDPIQLRPFNPKPVSPNATFGIQKHELPKFCPSAYEFVEGKYILMNDGTMPFDMPKKILT